MKKIITIFIAVMFLIGLLVTFAIKRHNLKGPEEPRYITQCMRTLDSTSPVLKNRDANVFQIKEYENIHDCQALLWRIPVKFKPEVKSLGANHNPDITQGVSIIGAFSSKGQLLPVSKDNTNETIDSDIYNKIELKSLGISFEEIFKNELSLATSYANSLNRAKKIDSKIKELEVYDSLDLEAKEPNARYVIFVPKIDADQKKLHHFIVECAAYKTNNQPKNWDERKLPHNLLPANRSCVVRSQVNERIYAEYRIKYSQLPQIEAIVSSVSATLKQFMLN
jgi:hypothetical protein